MLKNRTDYHTVWKLALELSPDEQIKLVEAVIDHLYGFGMWKDRKEMKTSKITWTQWVSEIHISLMAV